MATKAERFKDAQERSGPHKAKQDVALKHRPHRGERQDAQRAAGDSHGKPGRKALDRGGDPAKPGLK